MGNEVGCDIGLLIRDDFATEILQMSVGTVLADFKWITEQVSAYTKAEIKRNEITSGDNAEKLGYEIWRIKKKKKASWMPSFQKILQRRK